MPSVQHVGWSSVPRRCDGEEKSGRWGLRRPDSLSNGNCRSKHVRSLQCPKQWFTSRSGCRRFSMSRWQVGVKDDKASLNGLVVQILQKAVADHEADDNKKPARAR